MNLKETDNICNELIQLANIELEQIVSTLPTEAIPSFVLFTETIRVSDYWGFADTIDSNETGITIQDLDIIKMGWNLACSYLFKPIGTSGFPIMESSHETRHNAISLLYKLGCTTMIRRAVDMIRSGVLIVKKKENTYTFWKTDIANSQFIDVMEFSNLEKIETNINMSDKATYGEWSLVEQEALINAFKKPGNFLSQNKKDKLDKFLQENIDELMKPLIHPWDSGHGIMMGYGSTPEIDLHFLAKAAEAVAKWQDEAGLHPDTKLGNINGRDLILIVMFITSFHIKHLHFASIASKSHKQISIPQSLTIWSPLNELQNNIADFSGLDISIVSKALDAIMLKTEDANSLKNHTSKFMPLLIDMGNGFVLKPVSSIVRNPFMSIISLLEFRNQNIKNSISYPREEWLRTQLYALFAGLRYIRIDGNINLRNRQRVITDIDAAIYDTLTGELALFQLKWQDFFSNDVKKLRSKASNLTKELDDWAEKTSDWIEHFGISELSKNLRLKLVKEKSISAIYLFGISKNAARMKGYGFDIKAKNLAIANWPHFVRIRFELGPAERVFHQLFEMLKASRNDTVAPKPLPVKFSFSNMTINFADLWSTVED